MTETKEIEVPIEPASASADGKRNAYTLSCVPTGQSMNYAACLWRQGVLSDPRTITPADWSACGGARRNCSCPALSMQKEEDLAGKAIYFKDRNLVRKIAGSVNDWFKSATAASKVAPKPTTSSVAAKVTHYSPAPKAGIVGKTPGLTTLDAIGNAGNLSDAIHAAAKTPSSPPPAVKFSTSAVAVANTGESPLAMAQRIAAQRAAHGSF